MLPAELVHQFNDSRIFGAQLFATMMHPGAGDATATVIQAAIMDCDDERHPVLHPEAAEREEHVGGCSGTSPMFRQQQMIMYIFPIIFAVSGINFPWCDDVHYWTVSNLWSLGQQWWVIRNNPTPGFPGRA